MTIQSNPLVTSNKLTQTTDVSNDPQKVLVIGQYINGGTASNGELQASIGNSKEEDGLFGAGSQIAGAIRQFKEINKETRIDAIGLADNGSGVASTAEVEFTGTASEAGEINITVGSRDKHSYDLSILNGDDNVSVGSSLINAVNADTNAPFTAATNNTELVANGTFESDILNWAVLGGSGGTLEQSNTYSYTGSYSLRFYNAVYGNGFSNVTDAFTTVTGKTYRYSFAVKGVAGSVGEQFRFIVSKGDSSSLVILETVTLTDDWIIYSGEYIETGGGASARVQIEAFSATLTDVYFDDISIQEASNTVVLTAKNKGTVANNFGIETSGSVNGITTALTGWTGGATDPVLTNVFDVIGSERYQHIIFPSEYGFDFIDDFLLDRWNVDNNYITGFGYTTITDTLANLKITANTLNNQALVVIGEKAQDSTSYKGSAMMEFDYFKTASSVAVISLRLTEGSNLSRILSVKDASNDLIGGVKSSSLPIMNTLLSNLSIIDVDKGWTQQEINELKDVGISTIGNNQSRNSVITGQFVTTYKTDVAGNPDTSWKFLNHALTATGASEYFYNNAKSDFAQSRLTNGITYGNVAIHNADTIRAKFLEYFNTLSGVNYLLLAGGKEQKAIFDKFLSITLDLPTGKVTVNDVANMVSQIRELIINSQYGFLAE